MSGNLALYRKYRSLDFDQVIGQKHITDALKNSLESNRISHAYLFTGPKGVGKTSVARILAHRINGIEYTLESNHIDIIEIDAASNRRIDEIRDLREKAHIMPSLANYKVYIIDEVHMLTKEAFNALLKTLEEPPSHVVFILATTELHKLPATIISRTQRHNFKPISIEVMKDHLATIAKKENLKIDSEALQLLSEHAEGSARDAISLLDQVASLSENGQSINRENAETMLGFSNQSGISELLSMAEQGNQSKIIELLKKHLDQGAQPQTIAKQVIENIRSSANYSNQLDLVNDLMAVSMSSSPDISLEVALLKSATSAIGVAAPTATNPEPIEIKKPKPAEPAAPKPEVRVDEAPKVIAKTKKASTKTAVDEDSWQKFIVNIKKQNNAIASIMRTAEIDFEVDPIQVGVRFGFHKKKLDSQEIKALIRTSGDKAFGAMPAYEVYVVEANDAPAQPEIKTVDSDVADKVISTFGGGERVEI